MSLKWSALGGMVWVFIDTFFVKGVSFLSSILLARILSPNEFGLVALIAVFIAIGTIIVDSGMTSSLIRGNNNQNNDYSTVFFTNLFLAVLLYLVLFLFAPLIAKFYKQPDLIMLIRVYCLIFFLSAFSSVQTTILVKEMKFKKLALLNIPGVIIGGLVGIGMAKTGFGVWSIISMYLTTQFLLCFLLWVTSSWKPQFIFSKEKFKYHYNYGYKLFVSSLITTIFNNLNSVIIGKFYSLKTIGNYDRAYTLNQYPLIVLTQVIGKVTLPLLANIKEDKERVESIFGRLVNFTFFITAPIMLMCSALSKEIIAIVLGEKWQESAFYFQILCFAGLFYTLQALNVNILKIYGRVELILKGEIFLRIIGVIVVLCAIQIGLTTLLCAVVFNSALTLFINMKYCQKVLRITVLDQLKQMFPIFIAALIMFAFVKWFANLLEINGFSSMAVFAVSLIVGATIFLSVSYLFKVPSLLMAINFIKNKIKN